MSNSISTLLIRNLRDVFGETTRSGDAQRSTRSTPKVSFSMIPARVSTVAATRSIASQAPSRRLIPTGKAPLNHACHMRNFRFHLCFRHRLQPPDLISITEVFA
jgi:hypothetical protein